MTRAELNEAIGAFQVALADARRAVGGRDSTRVRAGVLAEALDRLAARGANLIDAASAATPGARLVQEMAAAFCDTWEKDWHRKDECGVCGPCRARAELGLTQVQAERLLAGRNLAADVANTNATTPKA